MNTRPSSDPGEVAGAGAWLDQAIEPTPVDADRLTALRTRLGRQASDEGLLDIGYRIIETSVGAQLL